MRAGVRLAFATAVLAATVIFLFIGTAKAQEVDCLQCHDGAIFDSPVHPDLVCQDCHANVPPDHEGGDLEPVTDADSGTTRVVLSIDNSNAAYRAGLRCIVTL